MMNELQKAMEILEQESIDNSNKKSVVNNDIDLSTFIVDTIRSNACSTIGIKFELGKVLVTLVYPSGTKLQVFDGHNEETYGEFCEQILKLDLKEKYNCSRTIHIDGVRTRVFAMTKPFSKNPNITISTTKIPPETLNKQTIPDSLFDKIIHSNFMVVGASGSGKTYLTNYLLNKFIKKDERIALIEEFGELIPPNSLTVSLIVPPPKPNEQSLLKFVTEQSNLMRLDAIYVGEIKGGEAWPFVVNLASGTRGGCTIHGENASQALNRLRALCKLSCDNDEAISDLIRTSIKYIIVMKNKNIESIHELMGTCVKGNFSMKEICS